MFYHQKADADQQTSDVFWTWNVQEGHQMSPQYTNEDLLICLSHTLSKCFDPTHVHADVYTCVSSSFVSFQMVWRSHVMGSYVSEGGRNTNHVQI